MSFLMILILGNSSNAYPRNGKQGFILKVYSALLPMCPKPVQVWSAFLPAHAGNVFD